MIKNILLSILIFALCVFLCSCSSNYSKDIHFIHAIFLDNNQKKDEYRILTVIEKQSKSNSKNDENFFCDTFVAKNYEKAIGKLSEKYENTYFASNTLYFFDKNTSSNALFNTALFLCQSNILPSKANAVMIHNCLPYDFLSAIKSQEDIKNILRLTEDKKINVIHFLANYNNKAILQKTPVFTLSQNNQIALHNNKEEG